jgi:hypothetical protein
VLALGVLTVGNFVAIGPRRSDNSKLIRIGRQKDQRCESTRAARLVVNDGRFRSLQSRVGTIRGCARVVREAIAMTSKVDLIVGRAMRAVVQQDVRLTVALESAARHDVEHGIRAVAVLRGVAAALCLERLDIARIELRADVAGDVGVRHRNAVDQPVDLMSAADMQLIVNDDGARHEVGDHRQAVRPIRARSALDVHAVDRVLRRGGAHVDRRGRGGHVEVLRDPRHREIHRYNAAGRHFDVR